MTVADHSPPGGDQSRAGVAPTTGIESPRFRAKSQEEPSGKP